MKSLEKNLIVSVSAALLIVLGTLFLFPQASWAQSNEAEYDFSAAKNEIATLSQFPQEINRSVTEVSQTSLGPWRLNVSCDYDCFIGICIHTQKFWYQVDYSGLRRNLEDVIRQAEQHSQQFSNTFRPVGDWFKIALPQFSSQFNTTSARILDIQAEIRQGRGPTPEQQAEVIMLLNQLSTSLKEQSEQLKFGTTSLATFLQEQNDYQRIITDVNNGLYPSIQAQLKKMQDFIAQQPCRGNADDQFNTIQLQFTTSVQKINNTLINLNTRTQQMDKSISILLGTITNFITKYQLVANQLNATQNAQLGSVIQSLHLNIAKQAWDELAKYATQQL